MVFLVSSSEDFRGNLRAAPQSQTPSRGIYREKERAHHLCHSREMNPGRKRWRKKGRYVYFTDPICSLRLNNMLTQGVKVDINLKDIFGKGGYFLWWNFLFVSARLGWGYVTIAQAQQSLQSIYLSLQYVWYVLTKPTLNWLAGHSAEDTIVLYWVS